MNLNASTAGEKQKLRRSDFLQKTETIL